MSAEGMDDGKKGETMLENEEDIIANGEQFEEWNCATAKSGNLSYIQHQADVLEYWLDEKIPRHEIGNLYRFDQVDEFDAECERIQAIPEFADVNRKDQRGATKAALGRYGKYLLALQAGTVDAEIANGAPNVNIIPAIPRNARARGRVINCLEGLIELIVGADYAELPKAERLKLLARHMVQKSYFLKPESVDRRHQEIVELIQNNDKLPTRFSSKDDSYKEENGDVAHFATDRIANRATLQSRIMTQCFGRSVPVIVDKDGNYEIRNIIERFSGARVSQGRLRNNIYFAIISHIWGEAYNPLCFSNLWNIVIVPDYVNSILDKAEIDHPTNFIDESINYVKAYYKELCYKMYNMGAKIEEYEQLGFNVRGFFAAAAASNLEDAVNIKQLNFLEDQDF